MIPKEIFVWRSLTESEREREREGGGKRTVGQTETDTALCKPKVRERTSEGVNEIMTDRKTEIVFPEEEKEGAEKEGENILTY